MLHGIHKVLIKNTLFSNPLLSNNTGCFQFEQTTVSGNHHPHPAPPKLPAVVPGLPHLFWHLQQTPRESLSGHRRQRRRSSCWHSRSSGPPESLSCCCPAKDRERWGRLSSLADSTTTDAQTSEVRVAGPYKDESFCCLVLYPIPGTVLSTSYAYSNLILITALWRCTITSPILQIRRQRPCRLPSTAQPGNWRARMQA